LKRSALLTSAFILGGLVLAGGGLALWKYITIRAANAAPPMAMPPENVNIVTIGTAKWRPMAELVGTVIAQQSITVSNEVAGTVKEVHFESGSIVEPGDVLLTLDASTEEADLRAGEAAVNVAEAEMQTADVRVRLAESNLKRLSAAMEAKAVSDADLDTAKAELDRAKADRARAGASLDQAAARAAQTKTLIAKKTIRAPFKARAGLRNVHQGQYLAEGTSVVSLQGISDKIFLDFAIPQDEAARARPGMKVAARGPVFGDQAVEIEVVALDATVNPTTRNVRVRGLVDNTGERLRPGMFVEIKVPTSEEREYTVVPNAAVRRASFGDHVYVVEPGPTAGSLVAKQRFVKLGPSVGGDVVVLEGLAPGERVAGAGSFKLRDGAAVAQAPPPAPAADTAQTPAPADR
jgi:membrane fusion protein, multidrug efflux system